MAKSKHSPALFELIDKGDRRRRQNPLAVPKWFGRKPVAEPSVPPSAGIGDASAAGSPNAEHLTLVPASDEESAFCMIQLGDRAIAMNYVSTIIAGCLVLLLLVSTFALGRITAGPAGPGPIANADGVDDVSKALQAPANPDTLKVGRQSLTTSRSGTSKDAGGSAAVKSSDAERPITNTPTAAREPGVNYIVIETFKNEHRKSGEAIRDWLKREYDCDTTLEKAGDRWRLVTALGFDYREPGGKESCEKFVNEVKSKADEAAKELSGKGLPIYRLLSPLPMQYPK